jgi:hypothetical protein
MPAVLGQIGFVGAVVVQHGPLRVIERGGPIISSIRNALECKLAAPLVRPARKPRGCRGCIRAVSSHSATGQGARLPPVRLPLLALVGQHTRRLGRFTHWLRSAV